MEVEVEVVVIQYSRNFPSLSFSSLVPFIDSWPFSTSDLAAYLKENNIINIKKM